MHILITDSGVGGLSVVAYAERFIREHGFSEPVKLTFANAAPDNDYGYNSMKTRQEKLDTFDRFLRNVTDRFDPDMIYVACNTLSVLLPDTTYVTAAKIPVKGIVETGVALILRTLAHDPRSVAMIFGTQTTIDAGTYPRLLGDAGVDASRIVSQACPGLADTISEDREGLKTRTEIDGWVAEAISRMRDASAPVVACLACTHYGYRKDMFAAAFDEQGVTAQVVNPNERAVDDLFGADARTFATNREVDVAFVTRYAIPPATVEALSWFLDDISPRTVAAMRNFQHLPALF
jgi:glutamate racemase